MNFLIATYLIEAVEVPFARVLLYDPRFFQQVVCDDAPHRIALVVELDVHVLAEATAVVVAIGFGVAETLQDGVALDEDVFHPESRQQLINVLQYRFVLSFKHHI